MPLLVTDVSPMMELLGLSVQRSPDYLHVLGQWITIVWKGEVECRVNYHNESGNLLFFADVADLTRSPYGEFMRIKEPCLAKPVPLNIRYVDAGNRQPVIPDQKIAGIITDDGMRFSLSNPFLKGEKLPVIHDDGSVVIDGETYYLHSLFQSDENRIVNYDAFLSRQKPEMCVVHELGNLPLF